MKHVISTFFIIFFLTGIALGIWYAGGLVLAIILGVLGLSTIVLVAFTLGSRWSRKMIQEGARIAISSGAVNDQHDALKTKALAELVGHALKQFKHNTPPTGFPAMPSLPPIPDQPLMLTDYSEANFTIAGLDDEDWSLSDHENDQGSVS